MSLRRKACSLLIAAMLITALTGYGQALPVNFAMQNDYYRRMQVMGSLDSSISFTIRPVELREFYQDKATGDSVRIKKESAYSHPSLFLPSKRRVSILPLVVNNQYNSLLPYGWNDGAMIPARGYQGVANWGIYLNFKVLTIQLSPEAVVAENKQFDGFPKEYPDLNWIEYLSYHTSIDLPERFGNTTYQKVLWGQSAIKLNAGALSFGLSNENLWWGPGIRNSLLMSNTAQGFKHLTLNTSRPVKTFFGSLEAQIIAAKMESSGFVPPDTGRIKGGYTPPRNDWRYLSGGVISIQPKVVPGLFLGITRSFMLYRQDMKTFDDYLPLLKPFKKFEIHENDKTLNQLASFFMRYVWPQAKFECYMEYGKEDHNVNLRDFLLEPDHLRAYIAGFRKLIPVQSAGGQYVQVSAEITHLQESSDAAVREAGGWYAHYAVRQGYTHNGEVLGAGIGPGGNLVFADLSWYKKLVHIGLQVDQLQHDLDFYRRYLQEKNSLREWVDYSAAILTDWNTGPLVFNAKVQYIQSTNYQWVFNRTRVNIHGELGVTCHF